MSPRSATRGRHFKANHLQKVKQRQMRRGVKRVGKVEEGREGVLHCGDLH